MVAKDLILDNEFIFNDETFTLRYYQRNAIIKLLEQYKKNQNGYAWHCSASGNSLSAYKLAQCFEKMEEIDKVVLITSKRDSLFRDYKLSIPTKKFLNDFSSNKLVVVSSSIFNFAINKKTHVLQSYNDLNVVFIIDDCMITTHSDNMALLKRTFSNANFYAFLAPPDFNEKLGHTRKINYYFKNKVSEYLLNDAIDDNVISNVNLKFLGNDNLDSTNLSKSFIASEVRIEKISKWIINNHENMTKNSKYSAFLFTPTTSSALKYYDILKNNTNLRIGVISKSYDEFKLMNKADIKIKLQEIFNDYKNRFHINKKYSSKSYKNDIMKKFNDGEFDLLITTSNNIKFNFERNNTLYWDYYNVSSRFYPFSIVDRKFDDEKEGNIIIFTDLNESMGSDSLNNQTKHNNVMDGMRYKLNDLNDLELFSGISGIYLLIHNDEVIYVGQSNNLKYRLKEHWEADINKLLDQIKEEEGRYNLTKFLAMYMLFEDNLDDIEFEIIRCSKSELNITEQKFIRKHKPKYNIQGVSKPFFKDVI